MYEAFLYAGAALAICFFITAGILFFKNRIPSVIKYFTRAASNKSYRPSVTAYSSAPEISRANEETTQTPDIANEQTEILGVARQYATALLEADSTTILPSLDEEDV